MKILFSPSEGKNPTKIISKEDNFDFLDTLAVGGEELKENVFRYMEILKSEDDVLCKLFGSKNLNSKSILDEMLLCSNMGKSSRTEAIRLYDGVAYKALDFSHLSSNSQEYIFKNVLIFSNLFGMVRADDGLPFYKYNQNFKSNDFGLAQLYKKLTPKIDRYLQDEKILDLRAEIYIKAYEFKGEHTRVEFLKNGKKVSHYAKYYRGIYLKELSEKQSDNLEDMQIKDLELIDVKHHKNITTLIYEVG